MGLGTKLRKNDQIEVFFLTQKFWFTNPHPCGDGSTWYHLRDIVVWHILVVTPSDEYSEMEVIQLHKMNTYDSGSRLKLMVERLKRLFNSVHIYIYLQCLSKCSHARIKCLMFSPSRCTRKVFHCSVSSTNLDFVHLRSIWFPNQNTRDLLWKWNGGGKMYRLWLLKLCNLHKFIYLSVSVQLIWEGKSFTSRSKKLNFHLNDAHHPVFEQSIFAEKRYYWRRDARDSTLAGSTSLEDMIPFTRATFATDFMRCLFGSG